MNTITVDDERFAVNSLLRMMKKADPNGNHVGTVYVEDFFEYIRTHEVDIAFVDVDLYDTDGITITKKLAKLKPDLNVIIYTGHSEYKAAALDLFVSGYLVKPVSESDLINALAHLRYPIKGKIESKLRVQCFGSFAVFNGDAPVVFSKTKTLELLAYLVFKRGAMVTMGELISVLWEDKPVTASNSSYLRQIISELRQKMKEISAEDIIIKKRNEICIDISKIECDWYDHVDGIRTVKRSVGFMEQYPWAERADPFLH